MGKFQTRRPRRGPLPMRYVLLLSFAFFIFSTIISIVIIDKGIEPTLMKYADSETKKLAAYVTNQAIEDNIANKNLKNQLNSVDVKTLNVVQASIENDIIKDLKEIETGKIQSLEEIAHDDGFGKGDQAKNEIFSVPLGKVTNIALLGNLGPNIPVQFQMVGDLESTDFKVKKEEYGINNALFYIYFKMKIKMQVVIPFSSHTITYSRDVPLMMSNEKGDVPQFYNGDSKSTNPTIEIPKSSK
ncbi:sporulation protein [Heyndrickxia ginsengihumi]|uniref:Sporulation protein n=1 Tax=Heyndrickxia ginsengihumi TaxID=363870 RepID=A0A0A6VBL5_9BACI|nr:sporulation protein YunB [Heyndrickxia ginsengihumi]KHD84966.1 sporulation protein [Heyndrickxia ginsengihumi]